MRWHRWMCSAMLEFGFWNRQQHQPAFEERKISDVVKDKREEMLSRITWQKKKEWKEREKNVFMQSECVCSGILFFFLSFYFFLFFVFFCLNLFVCLLVCVLCVLIIGMCVYKYWCRPCCNCYWCIYLTYWMVLSFGDRQYNLSLSLSLSLSL